ncbi:MAG TPA: hypothetical protein DDZ42_21970 [Candidatus Rokubacteria bacterium]|nr:MAG: hypothetical protein A2050_02870 [Candidatus Rokubacteria bacterium GWA2_73_35]HBH04545.1 hypothetical protein [Candidatus Rokubacteria bacterium]
MDQPVLDAVRTFVRDEVRPAAPALEHADRYPDALVARMRELGLFGALIPTAYGGLGLDVTTYARIIEELCRGFMSLAGVVNSHTMMTLIVLHHGTEEQRRRFLPRFASGETRGGLCLTEPHAGSDVQAIRTAARREGDHYVLDGTKMFITNGREGQAFALLAVTDPRAQPRHRGMSCFIVEKGPPGFRVMKSLAKLGYKGVDTVELVFEGVVVPAANLVGGVEGRGFAQVMRGLEAGRINIAARAVGVAQAALDASLEHAAFEAPTPLAGMATRVHAARLLTYWAAGMKDRGERCDLEAGMAKLFASEAAHEVALAALRWHGARGASTELEVERHYRDTPLMLIGEGTNEIQRTLIARSLVARHGETLGALTSREGEPEERRQMALAVRQFVDKAVVPVAGALDAAGRYPAELLRGLAELGVLGATIPPEWGGLGLEAPTWTTMLEELGRGSATLAVVVAVHLAACGAVARFGTPGQRERLLPALARGERVAGLAFGGRLDARRDSEAWVLEVPCVVSHAAADLFLARGGAEASGAALLVPRDAPGVAVRAAPPDLGLRGLARALLLTDGARLGADALLGGDAKRGGELALTALDQARLGLAAVTVGLAQAAFEAALRYSQQRTTFGQPLWQHQAVQLKLADMGTAITAARLLCQDAAERERGEASLMARVFAADTAIAVTLEAMRIHGGYGYIAEFPIERCYRDAAQLLLTPTEVEEDRAELGRAVADAWRAAHPSPLDAFLHPA